MTPFKLPLPLLIRRKRSLFYIVVFAILVSAVFSVMLSMRAEGVLKTLDSPVLFGNVPILGRPMTLPQGYLFSVRLTHPLSSAFNRVGDPVEAELLDALEIENTRVAEAGSKLLGHVEAVYPFTRSFHPFHYKGYLQIRFSELHPKHNTLRLPLNAIISSIDNTKGRLFGNTTAITVQKAKDGKEVRLPSGTILPLVLESAFTLGADYTPARYSQLNIFPYSVYTLSLR